MKQLPMYRLLPVLLYSHGSKGLTPA